MSSCVCVIKSPEMQMEIGAREVPKLKLHRGGGLCVGDDAIVDKLRGMLHREIDCGNIAA